MREHCKPPERKPVSVHAPFLSCPDGRYRHEHTAERQAALQAALHGVPWGADDQRMLHWLASWDVPTVATVVSLLRRRARHATTHHRGEPR